MPGREPTMRSGLNPIWTGNLINLININLFETRRLFPAGAGEPSGGFTTWHATGMPLGWAAQADFDDRHAGIRPPARQRPFPACERNRGRAPDIALAACRTIPLEMR